MHTNTATWNDIKNWITISAIQDKAVQFYLVKIAPHSNVKDDKTLLKVKGMYKCL